jgi:hypothetical protein
MIAGAKLVPADDFEFQKMIEQSSLKNSWLLQGFPQRNDPLCFKRVFKESEEHQRGGVYAVFDPATSTAVVFREYHD